MARIALHSLADKIAASGAAADSRLSDLRKGAAGALNLLGDTVVKYLAKSEGGDADEEEPDEDEEEETGEGGPDLPPGSQDMALGNEIIEVQGADGASQHYADATPILLRIEQRLARLEKAHKRSGKRVDALFDMAKANATVVYPQLIKGQVDHGESLARVTASRTSGYNDASEVLARHGIGGGAGGDAPVTADARVTKVLLAKALQKKVLTDAHLAVFRERGVFHFEAVEHDKILAAVLAVK